MTRVLSKTGVQTMLKSLRAAKLTVTKSDSGAYTVTTATGTKVFVALPGRNGYLVRMESDLFSS